MNTCIYSSSIRFIVYFPADQRSCWFFVRIIRRFFFTYCMNNRNYWILMSGELLNTKICVCFIIIIIELQFTHAVYSAIKNIFKFKFNFIIKPNDRPIFVYFFPLHLYRVHWVSKWKMTANKGHFQNSANSRSPCSRYDCIWFWIQWQR